MEKYQKDFSEYKNVLFPYAYNIVGYREEAEDIVQEVLIKYYLNKDHASIRVNNEKNYLISSVINRAINTKKRQQKTTSSFQGLPEPIATEQSDVELHLKDIISYSLLVILEKLSVKERAVFILKEAFHYSHKEIAEVISSSAENSRKLLSRAKIKIDSTAKTNIRLTRKQSYEYLEKYSQAIRTGDTKKLEKLFSEDIKVVADGGKHIQVLSRLTEGRKNCINLLIKVHHLFQTQLDIKFQEVNHQPAILFFNEKKLTSCQILSIDSYGKIYTIDSIVDPEKLKKLHID